MSTIPAPRAERRPYVHREHGDKRSDPYHWMRDRDDPAVIPYLQAENAYAEGWFAAGEDLREQLYAEMTARVVSDEDTVPQFEDGYWWYRRWEGDHEHGVLCRRRESLDAPEEIYLDVDAIAAGHACFLLGELAATRDGRFIAYAYDLGGDRRFHVRIRDTHSGQDIEDHLIDCDGNGLEFSPCGRWLFYVVIDPETLRSDRVLRHEIGTDSAQDVVIYSEDDETFDVGLGVSRSREWLLVATSQTLTDEWRGLPLANPTAELELLIERERGHECDLDHYAGQWLLRSNRDAVNFKLLGCAADGEWTWQEIIPHDAEVLLASVEACAHGLAIQERRDGYAGVRLRSWSGDRDQNITFAESCHSAWLGSNPDPDSPWVRIGYASLTEPVTVIDLAWADGSQQIRKRYAVGGGYDSACYATERVHATAADGAEIPISLVYRIDQRREGGNPLLLYGYGSYGATVDPYLNLSVVSLLDRGFVYAIAHVRGGQAKGRAWYEAGRHQYKTNTFGDFIACAEHLIADGWADPARLACEGHSAGGLLVGAVLNQRPDLFAAAIAGVPFVDCLTTMLDASIPLTTSEYDEWGNPTEPDDYALIKQWSPYDQIKPQQWPAVLAIAGFYDTQVHYWEPAKWVARIRETMTGGGPILLTTEMEVGHAGVTGRFGRYRDAARDYAFIARALS